MFATANILNDTVHNGTKSEIRLRRRILFVDDEMPILMSLKRALRSEFEIDVATGAADALDYVENNTTYAAIVSDMRMPDEDGVSFLSKVKLRSPATTRIMFTGDKSPSTAIEAVNRGHVFRFLEKPCSIDVMRSTLVAAICEFDKLTEQERVASGLLATFQHEFRTPLNHIVGFASYLAEEGASSEAMREYASYIQQSGQALSTTTDQLLTLSQLNQRAYQARMEWISPNSLKDSILDSHQDVARANNIALQVVIGRKCKKMFMDKSLMLLAIGCLISNGIKFNQPGGWIVVRLDSLSGYGLGPLIEVSDSGRGIDANQLEHSMRPFVQGEMSPTLRFGGIGIGLPLALAAANFHRGDLQIENVSGGGLTARICLPPSEENIQTDSPDV